MRRRSRAGGEVKKRRSKAATPKRSNAPKAVRYRSSSATSHEAEVVRLTRERDEALEQLSAASKILKVISSLPGDLKSVFEAILENATRICEAKFGILYRFDGEAFHFAAGVGTPPGLAEFLRGRGPFRPTRGGRLDNVMRTKQVSHTADITAEAVTGPAARLADARSTVCVPMLKDDVLVGAIFIYRQEVRPFTNKQIALVKNFATQAVIAIENTRLLSELRESLDRQTATADILRVIASTPENSKRALDTIAETAVRMFDAASVHFRRMEGDVLRIVGAAGPHSARIQEVLPDFPLESPDVAVRSFLDNRQASIDDRRSDLASEDGQIVHVLRDLPLGSQAFTPLSRHGKAIGLMIVTRSEVRPFKQDELDLMKGFADQAVITIENARLLNELRQSLEQQTATSEVLKIIAGSPGKLEPVFHEMLQSATLICEAKFGTLFLYDGNTFSRGCRSWHAAGTC